MEFYYWLTFLTAFGIGIVVIQNSNVPLVTIGFLIWRLETPPVYTILGSVGTGILVTLFIWVPRAVGSSIRFKESRKRLEYAESVLSGSARLTQQEN